MSETKSQQRSFRLTTSTTQLIDRIAGRQPRSRNDLVERMLAEAVRLEDHPIISFRTGGNGTRRACVAGSRLDVLDVVATFLASGRDRTTTFEHFVHVPERHVIAALDYYADFTDELDAALAERRVRDDDIAGTLRRRDEVRG